MSAEKSRPVRQFVYMYECDSCTYEAFVPDRNKHHFPRDEAPRLPGQPPRRQCPGTVHRIAFMRYVRVVEWLNLSQTEGVS